MRVDYLPSATGDLDAVFWYIAPHNEAAAERLIGRIKGSINRLGDYPRIGSPRPELGRTIRTLSVSDYLVIYRVEQVVEIIRVIHAARDVRSIDLT
ncbi:type II toxin-antitoxin system RelE/ParE family toxin [Sphingomonas qomolangmaensis]|uniref:Type II toxin-antitoxin system RelE/ParE family toxin n=1 Tax=Sphingomonas qomolangmaensis TaxID=2918765 RepID=A0ABY5L7N8_9SPHN|nr:type II toxin-antitoxin system RelE/ParE family toxin [Sphingomonas qomolangmaensis]UUL82975.1 type II toxin-antitoxin system RelE/ParE family toxin [Sphingomonas qomolangmaensis]